MTSSAVSQYIGGQTPGADALLKMAIATRVDPTWLLTGRGVPRPPLDASTTESRARLARAATELADSARRLVAIAAILLPLLTSEDRQRLRAVFVDLATQFEAPPPE